jgi:hypothetical protein
MHAAQLSRGIESHDRIGSCSDMTHEHRYSREMPTQVPAILSWRVHG